MGRAGCAEAGGNRRGKNGRDTPRPPSPVFPGGGPGCSFRLWGIRSVVRKQSSATANPRGGAQRRAIWGQWAILPGRRRNVVPAPRGIIFPISKSSIVATTGMHFAVWPTGGRGDLGLRLTALRARETLNVLQKTKTGRRKASQTRIAQRIRVRIRLAIRFRAKRGGATALWARMRPTAQLRPEEHARESRVEPHPAGLNPIDSRGNPQLYRH